MCGGGTTPILARSGVPAISRPPLGGGVGSVLENGEGGGGYFLEKFAQQQLPESQVYNSDCSFYFKKIENSFLFSQIVPPLPLETVSWAGTRNKRRKALSEPSLSTAL